MEERIYLWQIISHIEAGKKKTTMAKNASVAAEAKTALEENDHVFLTIAVNDVVKAIRKNKEIKTNG